MSHVCGANGSSPIFVSQSSSYSRLEIINDTISRNYDAYDKRERRLVERSDVFAFGL